MPICDQCGGEFEGVSKHDLMNDVSSLRAFLKKIRRIMDRACRKNGNGILKTLTSQIGKVIEVIDERYRVDP